jgi:hypothetical protein
MIISSITQNTNGVIPVVDTLQGTQARSQSLSLIFSRTSPVIPAQAGIQNFIVSFSLSTFFVREAFS